MTGFTRRDFLLRGLAAGMGAAALSVIPRPLLADLGRGVLEPLPPIRDARVKELALRAIEAARAAGATYADVRLTHTWERKVGPKIDMVGDSERMSVGVRALVDGYWGFAGSPIWSPDEMARLGYEAVHHARTMATGPRREIELATAPAVDDGHWVMPVEIDPFGVSPFEIVDFLMALRYFVGSISGFTPLTTESVFHKQEKAFASSEGSYCTQQLFRTSGRIVISLTEGRESAVGELDTLTPAGVGWELFSGQSIHEQLRQLMDELREEIKLPVKPVEVGRYETVCDAKTVARLTDATLGTATQIDRALGYEANASGTSYLNEPLEMLGNYEVGGPRLTLTGNRTEQGGAATVRWDDEGVQPDEFTIVRDGVLEDYQTTRESAGWLAEYYRRVGRTVRSHGCANAPAGVNAPLLHTPNLTVAPGGDTPDFDGLVSSIGEGLAVKDLGLDMDFQGLNGMGLGGRIYEVKDGKRVARIAGAGILFRAPELWKGLVEIGGVASLRRYGMIAGKGEPEQRTYHSVTAPAAVFGEMTVIDPRRKA